MKDILKKLKNGTVNTGSGKQEDSQRSKANVRHCLI